MRKAKNFSNRLMAMLLSVTMIFAPIFESVSVYAAEAGTEMEGIGTLSEETSQEMISLEMISQEAVGQTGTGDANDIQLFSAMDATLFAASTAEFSNVGGWNESIYAEISGVSDADVTAVSWSGTMTGSLTGEHLEYLVRDNGSESVRIDIPGLKAGTYTLSVTVGGQTLQEEGITVYAYDRSGYAHFNYTDGVGAYKDDGTLKDNAIVLYVTDKNKNYVTVTCDGITVTGIGNILNSAGQESSDGKTSKGGKANDNKGIIKKLAEAGTPLVVRFIGYVSETGHPYQGIYNAADEGLIEGLTDYNSLDNGGSVGDNGHMARIQSGKDITLEGIGNDATIDGWGFHYIAQSAAQTFGKSFEVRNLTFINTPEDAVGMEGVQANGQLTASVERCWIHNNEFYRPDITNPAEDDKAQGDGSVDFKRGQYYTCSYNYFAECHKTNLVGGADDNLQYNITFHHNHYYLVEERGPLARQANIHMYNNLYEMQTSYAMNPRANAYIFSEYNMFYASKNPQMIQGGGVIKSYHDCYASVMGYKEATAVTDKTTYVQNNCKYNEFDINSQQSYIPTDDYKLDTDFTELRKVIASQTGVQARKPKLPSEVTASDYSVIPASAKNNKMTSLPQALTPSTSQGLYVFTVNEAFNLEVAYEGTTKGVLINEAGEDLLTGDGNCMGLPAGTYMIQSEKIAVIAYPIKWDGLAISILKLEAADAAGGTGEPKTLTFNYNYEGAPAAMTVQASLNKSYASVEILVPVAFRRDGYKLAGLYQDANLTQPVSYPYVVSEDAVFYADWNASEVVRVLDCTNLAQENITKKTTINGFTIHALPGGGGANQDSPKYYMTVRPDGLCTNGVLLTDTSIPGNEDGLLKSIEFTTGGPAVLTVEGALSGNGVETGTYKLVLAEKSGNGSLKVVDSLTVPYDRTPINKPFNIDEAGTYYLYATGDKGVVYYNLKLTEQVYTVRYQVRNGTVPEGQVSIIAREGEEIQLPECTANPGYIFRGWSMDGGRTMLTSYTVKTDDVVDGRITITAYYSRISYTVKFDANGGRLPEGMDATRQVTAGDIIPLGDCIPGKAGQQFLGWTVNNSGNRITKSYTVDPADAIEGKDGKELKLLITLKAVYTEVGKVYYTVKFDAGDGKLPGIMESSYLETDDILELGECTPPTAAQQFIGWSVDGTGKKVTSFYKVNDADAKDVDGQKVITLKAVYTEEGKTYYTVRFSAEGGSLPMEMSATVTAEAGDLLILGECAPPEARRFKGWSVNGSAEPITSEYRVKAEDADGKGVIVIKAFYVEKDTGIAIIGLEDKYEYTGAKIIPNIGVVDYDIGDGRILAPGVDYSVRYKDNSKLGVAKVVVTGKGNYAGQDIDQNFSIVEAENPGVELKDLKGAKLGKIDAVTYNGKAQYPNLTLTLKGVGAVDYTYDETARVYRAADGNTIPAKVAFSNNINKGTATILLTGANDSKNRPTKLKKTFKINAIDISKAAMGVTTEPGTYGVKAASPASITVTCNGVKLKNGTDYTVKYSANKNATTSAKITITGKGNYTKKHTSTTYTINKLDLSEDGVGIKAVTAYRGMTAGKVKATVTDKNGNTLKASQYTLKVYRDESEDEESEYRAGDRLDEEAGEIYVKVFAKDGKNLTGETDIVAVNVATNIAKAKIELRKEGRKAITKEYTGQAIELDEQDLIASARGEEGEMEPIYRGTDYEIVSYSNNINKGTATAVIQGIGSYSGTKTIKFKIVGKTMRIKNKTTWIDTSGLIQGLFGSR